MTKDKSMYSNIWFFSSKLEGLSSTAGATLRFVNNWRSVVFIPNANKVDNHTNN